jgi:hypothetical protein
VQPREENTANNSKSEKVFISEPKSLRIPETSLIEVLLVLFIVSLVLMHKK